MPWVYGAGGERGAGPCGPGTGAGPVFAASRRENSGDRCHGGITVTVKSRWRHGGVTVAGSPQLRRDQEQKPGPQTGAHGRLGLADVLDRRWRAGRGESGCGSYSIRVGWARMPVTSSNLDIGRD